MNAKTILTLAFAGLFAATAATAALTGVTVNGVELDDIVSSSDTGWAYDSATYLLTLDGAGPVTLSGENRYGKVQVVVRGGVTAEVTLSNLRLRMTSWEIPDNVCGFALETDACVSLLLEGENIIQSTSNRAGVEVPAGASLSITNAPDDSAGTLLVYGGYQAAGIGSGKGGAAGAVTINGGAVAVQGGYYSAGIGGSYQGTAGSLTVNGGEVVAIGDFGGAGIGGGQNKDGGTVTITGGSVTAEGGTYGAGIGGGGSYNYYGGAGGTVTISGGRVSAMGGNSGAGIGGGQKGAGGTVTISGGTVFAQGTFGSADIGPGRDSTVPGANTFIGGSIRLGASSVVPAPTDGTDPVACAVVAGFEPGEPVAITAGLAGYGVNDIFADDAGCIYLWLPNGTYTFTANGRSRTVSIQNGVGPTGVTVNGEEVAYAPAGPVEWSFDPATHTLRLSGAGPFTLAGVNVIGGVCVAVPDNVANKVTLANLTLRTAGSGQCAFALGTGANVSLSLAGTNVLASGPNRAGLEVAAGRTLFITNAPSDEAGTLFAYGGNCGAGIGGGKNDTGGTITMAGGAVMATSRSTGSYGGAGIGGGAYATGGDVMVTGGSLTATGGNNAPGIGGGATGGGGSLTISGGTVVATGEGNGAGVGGGEGQAGGAVTVTGGSLTATGGGSGGAGIGGGAYAAGAGGSLTVSGGQVVASGYTGAGIGGGHSGTGGVVVVSGGMIIAQSSGGAGIGGGYRGAGGTCTIKGGTVFSQSEDGADIGPGMDGAVAGANTFIGGSIRLGASSVVPAPTDGTDPVACAVVAGFEPGELVAITGLPSTYGVNDIFADDAGCIYLWLPNGTYTFTANGRSCTVSIQNGIGPTGVTVNGEDVAFAPTVPGGWSFDPATHTLKLLNAGPFTLAGANVVGGVQVVIPEGVANAVTLSNLTLRATGDSQCAFALETNAVVAFVLAGSNTLASGYSRAGLEVTAGRTLTVTNAPGDEAGALTATGGYAGAGIGGGNKGDGGALTINGGVVTAFGGVNFASGIGGGANGGGGTVTINGGTVTAVSTRLGAGIGTGGYAANQGRASGTVTISGGTVTAIGGELGAGIGGGDNDPGGTVTISGGTVTATGGERGAGIGGGYNYSKSDSTLVSGGTVTISGGRVAATGGLYAAGIGGGAGRIYDGGAGAMLSVSGGTIFATGGTGGGPGIGGGLSNVANGGTTPNVSGTSTFIGGSIRIDGDYAAAAPSNGAARVWCVTVPNLTPGEAIVVASLEPYGVDDLFADDVGKLYLWLPNGSYAFTADGTGYTATVADAATTATGGGGIPAPVFATDGSGIVVSGTTLTITITNVQGGIWYTLYAVDTLGGTWDWQQVQSVYAVDGSDLTFENVSATPTKRFFKVVASESQP
jgi:hypothetical protein